MKKIKAVITMMLVFTFVFSFTGCTLRFSSLNQLIRPPKLSAQYQGLQDSFEHSVDIDYTLRTPENGKYQSAYITYDIDGDGVQEAIVFYSTDSQPDNIQFCYFEYDSGEWKIVDKYDGLGSNIDQVAFADFNADGVSEVVIGWSLFSSKKNKAFSVYTVENNALFSVSSFQYTYFDIIDIDSDGFDDLFTLYLDSSVVDNVSAYARAYSFNSKTNSLELMGETLSDGNITSYSEVKTEMNNGVNYIYIDAYKAENEMITEVIYWDDELQTFISPLFDSDSKSTRITWRKSDIKCTDIDNDSKIEIPTGVLIPNSSVVSKVTNNTESFKLQAYFIKWTHLKNDKLESVKYTYINKTYQYMITIPSSWVSRITVNDNDGQLDFYRYDSSTQKTGNLLFSVYCYGINDKDKYKDLKEIKKSDNKIFVYSISDSGYDFGIKDDTIINGFTTVLFGGK